MAEGERTSVLECSGVYHWFGSKRVLHNVRFSILRGQIVALVGPSGCGKSTLLRAILGTHLPRKGDVAVCRVDGGRSVVRSPGRDRGIVYQNYALFEFLSVVDNVAFGLMLDQTSPLQRMLRRGWWKDLREQHRAKAATLLDKVGLGDSLHRFPSELSGGMRQRVAIAQALVMEPEVLLLDEPFGALDEATREGLQRLLLTLYSENLQHLEAGRLRRATTILIVTHELTEAIFVADRVLGLSQYWDWQNEGHPSCPGATVVYDMPAPVFDPDDVKRHEEFVEQREEIYHAVFDPDVCQQRHEFIEFRHQVQAGRMAS